MKIEEKCVAKSETMGHGSKKLPAGHVRKVHRFLGGDFCVYCGAARR